MRNRMILAGVAIFASEIIWHLCRRFYNQRIKLAGVRKVSKVKSREPKQNISEVMFFTKESSLCRQHAVGDVTCVKDNCPVRYLRKLEGYINGAEKSVDVCMYTITCQLLSNVIVEAHKRGLLVRIIMDQRMAGNSSSEVTLFHRNGIVIKLEHLDGLMHHKFAIVDNEIVITGSTNWTMSAFFGNFEHVLVTNECTLVKPFVEEFNRLWKTFSKSKDNSEDPIEWLAASSDL